MKKCCITKIVTHSQEMLMKRFKVTKNNILLGRYKSFYFENVCRCIFRMRWHNSTCLHTPSVHLSLQYCFRLTTCSCFVLQSTQFIVLNLTICSRLAVRSLVICLMTSDIRLFCFVSSLICSTYLLSNRVERCAIRWTSIIVGSS